MPPESPITTECPPDAAFLQLLEGRIAGPEAARLEGHAAGCSACRALLDGLTAGPTAAAHVTAGAAALEERIAEELLRPIAAPGAILGGSYRLVRQIGAGGMGAVYEAERIGLVADGAPAPSGAGERFAVKLIKERLLAAGSEVRDRFRREARAAGALAGVHIVRVVDSGADEVTGNLYLVMEYLDGEDLQRLIGRVGPLRPDVALRIGAQALAGLVEAHAAGIVHRDIKPANLFLARDGTGGVTVKLVDFGIAKIAPGPLGLPDTSGLTQTGGLLGSPLYMSPEQVQNSKDVDHRTDLWSLGSTLYCALSGRAPHRDAGSVGKLILAICGAPAPPLAEVAPWVPAEVAEVVERALSIPREGRYPSAAAMLGALRARLEGEPVLREEMLVGLSPDERARRPAAGGRRSPPEVVPEGGGVPERADRPPTGGSVWRIAAGAAMLLGVAMAAYRLARPSPHALPAIPAPPREAPPAPTAPEGVSTTPAAPEAPRHVMLVVLPEDALVEIDGVLANVQSGAVDVAGALGSEHRVRVWKGEQEAWATVTVTERGPLPPKVQLPPRRPAAAGPRPEARRAPAGASSSTKPTEGPEPPAGDVMRRPE